MDSAANHQASDDVPLDMAGAVAGALGWWREAGVDYAFADAPLVWEAAIAAPKSAPPAADAAMPSLPERSAAAPANTAPRPEIGGPRESWPRTLAEFAPWWLAEPSLSEAPCRLRVPPRGASGAALMVLVPEPEPGDGATLLAGPQGALLGAMLAAMGVAEHETYAAAALPARLVHADWADLGMRGLGAVLAHHVRLVAPRRLLLLSGHLSPLLGHDPAQSSVYLPFINHEGADLPILATHDLASLQDRGGARAGFWQKWLDWTASP